MHRQEVYIDGTRYIDHGPAVRRVRVGTAAGVLHREESTISERPTCAYCGTKARYSRACGGSGDWSCKGCDAELDGMRAAV